MSYEQLLVDLGELFNQFKTSFLTFLPKLVYALVIIGIGILIARLFRTLVNRLIKNLDRLMVSKKLQDKLSQMHLERSAQMVGNMVFWIIVIFFITAATEILGLPIISTWLSGIMIYLPNILIATIIVFLGIIGGTILYNLVTSATAKTGLLYGNVLGRIVQYAIVLITILIAIDQIGIDIAVLTDVIDIILAATLFGAALAFGLGAKTSVSNILAAYYLQSRYQEGNSVKIGDVQGKIIQFTPTAVIVESAEGKVLIPAKKFSEEQSILIKS